MDLTIYHWFLIAALVAIVVWAHGRRRKARFEKDAEIPFDEGSADIRGPRRVAASCTRKDRKKVEMLFAHLKRIMKLDRLRLRGLSGAKDEFLMAATAQNLRRMAKSLAPITT